jgi:hypothetical protein
MSGAVVWEHNHPRTMRRLDALGCLQWQPETKATLLPVAGGEPERGYASANGKLKREPFAHKEYVTLEALSLLGLPSGDPSGQHYLPDRGDGKRNGITNHRD